MQWPTHLVKELADRRAIIFLGSGISASATGNNDMRPPTWAKFLENFLPGLKPADADAARFFIQSREYLNAAEIIQSGVPHGDFENIIQSSLVTPRFRPSGMHNAINAIDTKIVITTNYDKIYEKLCANGDAADSYSIIRYHDTNLITDLRSPKRIIVKAHGCVTQISKVVLSKSSYFAARREYRNFYSAMDGLFITNTLLFLGYSINDPDITLLLENANISAPSDNVHYCVMPDDIHPAIISMMRSAYNVHMISFPAGRYEILEQGLSDLATLVQEQRENSNE